MDTTDTTKEQPMADQAATTPAETTTPAPEGTGQPVVPVVGADQTQPPVTPAPAAQTAPPAEAAQKKDDNRQYGVYTEVTLDLSSAAARKEAIEGLASLLVKDQGTLTVLAKVGRAVAPSPRQAITSLGQVRDLDGDYEVVADSSRNKFPKVKTAVRRDVSIG